MVLVAASSVAEVAFRSRLNDSGRTYSLYDISFNWSGTPDAVFLTYLDRIEDSEPAPCTPIPKSDESPILVVNLVYNCGGLSGRAGSPSIGILSARWQAASETCGKAICLAGGFLVPIYGDWAGSLVARVYNAHDELVASGVVALPLQEYEYVAGTISTSLATPYALELTITSVQGLTLATERVHVDVGPLGATPVIQSAEKRPDGTTGWYSAAFTSASSRSPSCLFTDPPGSDRQSRFGSTYHLALMFPSVGEPNTAYLTGANDCSASQTDGKTYLRQIMFG